MKQAIHIAIFSLALSSCTSSDNELAGLPTKPTSDTSIKQESPAEDFKYIAEQFADLRVLRHRLTDFDKLDLKTKTLVYYLSEAALCGRDIIYDQNYKIGRAHV